MIFFFDLLFSLYPCWILTPGSLKLVQYPYWPSHIRIAFEFKIKKYNKRSGVMGSRVNNSVWSQNEHFFQFFFYFYRGATKYKNNYENDSY